MAATRAGFGDTVRKLSNKAITSARDNKVTVVLMTEMAPDDYGVESDSGRRPHSFKTTTAEVTATHILIIPKATVPW